jgi:hypothetical protein
MPYTKEELKNVDFYTEFVSKLRTSYLEDLQEFATIGFRQNNILYSFEDIISSNGIETVEVSNTSLYHDYLTKEQQELSKTLSTQSYPRYIKTGILEKIIDRSISELATDSFAVDLPPGTNNGDVITNEDPVTYYGREYVLSTIVTLTDNQIATIPDGEPIA